MSDIQMQEQLKMLRNAVLEEAAKVADTEATVCNDRATKYQSETASLMANHAAGIADRIAAAIRALASPQGQESGVTKP